MRYSISRETFFPQTFRGCSGGALALGLTALIAACAPGFEAPSNTQDAASAAPSDKAVPPPHDNSGSPARPADGGPGGGLFDRRADR